MATNSETTYAKKILLGANLIFALIGFVFLIVKYLQSNQFNLTEYITLCIFGLLLLIFTYLGVFSKMRNDDFTIIIFSACLLLIFISEMSLGLSETAYNYKKFFVESMINKYPNESADQDTLALIDIDKIQSEHKCCGFKSPQDWLNVKLPIPSSCCSPMEPTKSCDLDSKELYRMGCYCDECHASLRSDEYSPRGVVKRRNKNDIILYI